MKKKNIIIACITAAAGALGWFLGKRSAEKHSAPVRFTYVAN